MLERSASDLQPPCVQMGAQPLGLKSLECHFHRKDDLLDQLAASMPLEPFGGARSLLLADRGAIAVGGTNIINFSRPVDGLNLKLWEIF